MYTRNHVDIVRSGKVNIKYVESNNNLAGIFTKSLKNEHFSDLVIFISLLRSSKKQDKKNCKLPKLIFQCHKMKTIFVCKKNHSGRGVKIHDCRHALCEQATKPS